MNPNATGEMVEEIKRRMKIYAAIIALSVGGCSGITTQHVDIEPRANACQVTEVRPSWFSTQVLGVCWDEDKQVIGMTGSGGQPAITVPLAVLSAGATVGGAYVLGSYIYRGGQAVSEIDLDASHHFEVPAVPPGFIPPGLAR